MISRLIGTILASSMQSCSPNNQKNKVYFNESPYEDAQKSFEEARQCLMELLYPKDDQKPKTNDDGNHHENQQYEGVFQRAQTIN